MDLVKALTDILEKLSQQEVGERLGISQATVSRIRNRKITNPSFKTASAILKLHSEVSRRAA